MTIMERIIVTLDEKNKRAIDLCRALGIRTSTMSTWKSKRRDPPAAYMPQIANFLGVSIEYLLTGEDRTLDRLQSAARAETKKEQELLNLYRQLPAESQYEFIGELKGFLRYSQDSADESNGKKNTA